MKTQKFKVAATGKVIKVQAIGKLEYKDVKTGKVYDIGELEYIPEKHSATWGFHIGKFGMYFFARDYFKFKTFQLGVGFDIMSGKDSAYDTELKFGIAGVGLRIIILK